MGGVFTLIIHKNTRRSLDRFHDADYLRQRTVEGMETARLNGKQIGGAPGKKLHVKKAEEAKELIKQLSKDFDGTLTDVVMIEKKLAGVSRRSTDV